MVYIYIYIYIYIYFARWRRRRRHYTTQARGPRRHTAMSFGHAYFFRRAWSSIPSLHPCDCDSKASATSTELSLLLERCSVVLKKIESRNCRAGASSRGLPTKTKGRRDVATILRALLARRHLRNSSISAEVLSRDLVLPLLPPGLHTLAKNMLDDWPAI